MVSLKTVISHKIGKTRPALVIISKSRKGSQEKGQTFVIQ